VSVYQATVDPAERNTSHTMMLELVGGNKAVLDVGCASGYLAEALGKNGNVVSGIEYDAGDAEKARPFLKDLVVADLSFISLTKVLPAVLATCAPGYDALAMVKPQFEVGRERVGRGGVVRDPALRREAVLSVATFVRDACAAAVMGFAPSGLPGPKGNLETFVHVAEAGRDGELEDLEAALDEAGA